MPWWLLNPALSVACTLQVRTRNADAGDIMNSNQYFYIEFGRENAVGVVHVSMHNMNRVSVIDLLVEKNLIWPTNTKRAGKL